MKFNKILVLQQNSLGDVVVSTGVLRALRERFPNSHIAFLVSPETAAAAALTGTETSCFSDGPSCF